MNAVHQLVGHTTSPGTAGWHVTTGCGLGYSRGPREPLPADVTAWPSRTTCTACRARQGLGPTQGATHAR